MKGDLIIHMVHIMGTRNIEAGIDGISRGKNLEGMIEMNEPA